MITVKSKSELISMHKAGIVVEEILKLLEKSVAIGVTTRELNEIAAEYIQKHGAKSPVLGYNGYPADICISVNEQVVHGIPGKYKLKDGDIVSCDVVAGLSGWYADATRTFLVGNVSEETRRLVTVTRECFFEGIKLAKPGNRISDISAAIQRHAEENGYGVIREYIGHGIGSHMHEDPEVPNFVAPNMRKGVRLQPGMTLAIEPMIAMGDYGVHVLNDGWTVVTNDGKPSAHYENTIAITESEPIILTETLEGFDG